MMLMESIKLVNDWESVLKEEFKKKYFLDLIQFLKKQKEGNKIIYPDQENIFKAFQLTTIKNIKVVILGQDPYHGDGQAHGLSFSVPEGVKLPPSLKNILKELESDLNVNVRTSGDLSHWAEQGVLLLNAVLTVEAGLANSHQGKGWEQFTDEIIKYISSVKKNVVFILWGSYAQKKKSLIDDRKHFIIEGVHPSPLSSYRGFFGSRPFSKTNQYLKSHGIEEIQW